MECGVWVCILAPIFHSHVVKHCPHRSRSLHNQIGFGSRGSCRVTGVDFPQSRKLSWTRRAKTGEVPHPQHLDFPLIIANQYIIKPSCDWCGMGFEIRVSSDPRDMQIVTSVASSHLALDGFLTLYTVVRYD